MSLVVTFRFSLSFSSLSSLPTSHADIYLESFFDQLKAPPSRGFCAALGEEGVGRRYTILSLNSTCFKSPLPCCATLHNGTQRLHLPNVFLYLSVSQKIVIEGKKYSWYVYHMAKIPHPFLAHHHPATPVSRVIAPPPANTQTDRSSRFKRRGDRLPNVHTVVNFARPSRFTSSATAVMYVSERVNQVQVNPPALRTVHLFNQSIHSSQESTGSRVSKRSPRNPHRHRHPEFGTWF